MSMRIAVSALSAVMVLAGCTPTTPVTSPSPAPTFQCTPEAGGVAAPCSQAEFEQMQKTDALYAEAERVYRKYLAEDERVARQGGAAQLTKGYKETIGDPVILRQTLKIIKQNKAEGRVMRGGDVRLIWLKRTPALSVKASLAALAACIDASSSRLYMNGEYVGQGAIYQEEVFYQMFGDDLKISSLNYEMVQSCEN
ncbi:MAG: hypothetical protein IPL43_04545 [Micropruina sp.]|nr:hypothetical protein [Micropruina sp.]